MNYKVDYKELKKFSTEIADQSETWKENLTALKKDIDNLASTNNMSGQGADNIKAYLKYVHLTLINELLNIIFVNSSRVKVYMNDYHKIDKENNAIIDVSELNQLKKKLNASVPKIIDIDEAVLAERRKVRDIISLPHKDINDIDDATKDVAKHIKNIVEKVNDVEIQHTKNSTKSTDSTISAVLAIVLEQLTMDRYYKTDFSYEAFTSSTLYDNLLRESKLLDKEIEENVERYKEAIQNEEELELEERQKLADAINDGVGLALVLAGIAITFATGGLGTGAMLALVGARSAITTATEKLTEQYVEHGNLIENSEDVEWGECIITTAAVVTFDVATYYFGGKIASKFQGKLSAKAGDSSSKILKSELGAKATGAVVGSVGETLKGVATRAGKESIKQVTSREFDFGKVFDKAFNTIDMGKDALYGGIDGARSGTSPEPYKKSGDEQATRMATDHAVDDYKKSIEDDYDVGIDVDIRKEDGTWIIEEEKVNKRHAKGGGGSSSFGKDDGIANLIKKGGGGR